MPNDTTDRFFNLGRRPTPDACLDIAILKDGFLKNPSNKILFLHIEKNVGFGSSNKYPQSMFLSRNKKINVYLCKPQFYNIKVGFKGVKII